ncbi:hypothetical protein GC093_26225 [Paenibacillus sp. LMG 31456]|uniref:Uncharacterized protein n=1 Tax=Paenibacillus foliorum TaxID=2654974 RepID=A0A972GY62_9BACL|nr:hypothetical protein [Paenibacillus foliorum]
MKLFDLGSLPTQRLTRPYARQQRTRLYFEAIASPQKPAAIQPFGRFIGSLGEFMQMCSSFSLLAETGLLCIKLLYFCSSFLSQANFSG